MKTEQPLLSVPAPLQFKRRYTSEDSCVDQIEFKGSRPVPSSKQCFCDALQHLVLYNFNNSVAPALLATKKREHCRIVLYLRNGVSTGKGGIYFRRVGPVRYSYCRITRFGCHCEFTLPSAYFAVSACIFFALPPLPRFSPLIAYLSFPLNYLVAFCLQVSFTCLFTLD